jgi:hypothetical protein
MKSLVIVSVLLFASVAAYGAKSCEELKGEIAKQLDAKGIKFYSLEIVPNEKVKDQAKVVGTCDGGKKKILYSRTTATTSKPAESPNTPVPSKP